MQRPVSRREKQGFSSSRLSYSVMTMANSYLWSQHRPRMHTRRIMAPRTDRAVGSDEPSSLDGDDDAGTISSPSLPKSSVTSSHILFLRGVVPRGGRRRGRKSLVPIERLPGDAKRLALPNCPSPYVAVSALLCKITRPFFILSQTVIFYLSFIKLHCRRHDEGDVEGRSSWLPYSDSKYSLFLLPFYSFTHST
ncbi:hypothetical protein ACEPAF_5548 [Sanghuangporus sanghuang]